MSDPNSGGWADIAVTLYQIPGALTGLWCYCTVAFAFFVTGQWGMCFAWCMFIGPIVSGLLLFLWPLYWLLAVWGAS